jgi:hypothetical protein
MLKKLISSLVLSGAVATFAAPEVNFSGYLDADVWADLKGKYFANSELDLGLEVKFSDKVSAHVYSTVLGGAIPAGTAAPEDRWVDVKFDGIDLTYASKVGTFTVGDLVYQYGKFNYYYYKRLSMITPESFTRGIKYSLGNDLITQELSLGVSDLNDVTGDLYGSTSVTFGENASLGVYYGIRGSSQLSFKEGTNFFAGTEFSGSFGDALKIKADVGFNNFAGVERKSTISLLLEPTLTLGSFSTALTGYMLIDPDTADLSAFKLGDEAFVYIEPGYTFNDYLGVGLPLEIHGFDKENELDNQFWTVPTFYVYPTANVQWWIWGQMVVPMFDGVTKDDFAFGLGSEIIVTF